MGNLHDVVANVLACDIIVSKFKLQLHYYVHFWANTLGKLELSYFPSYGLNSTTTVFQQS